MSIHPHLAETLLVLALEASGLGIPSLPGKSGQLVAFVEGAIRGLRSRTGNAPTKVLLLLLNRKITYNNNFRNENYFRNVNLGKNFKGELCII